MDIHNKETFTQFKELNPLEFSERRMQLAENDFYRPRHGLVSDEYVEYVLWAEGTPARHEQFGEFLLPTIKANGWRSLLEVGCGEAALLSRYLYDRLCNDVSITAVDQSEITCRHPKIRLMQKTFTGAEDLTGYDAVIALDPCEAAELIVKACTEQNVPYCVVLCGVPHRRLTGELDEDAYGWYAYLISTYPDCGFRIWKNGRFSSGCIYSKQDFDKKDVSEC